ncbi:MAG: MATE family efflux transporter [Oscillospiraceae bacterium]|nr:MATE family efflux transporter [Oscillospiraceae bacterium]
MALFTKGKDSRSALERGDMTQGNVTKQLIQFALPVLGASVFTQLYNVVDSITVGQYVGSTALAAVGASAAINMVCHSLLTGIGMGSGVLIAQNVGSKKMDEVKLNVRTSFWFALVFGIAMMVLGLCIANPILRALKTPGNIMEQATLYLRIVFLGLLGQMFFAIGGIVVRSFGDSRYPMFVQIVSAVVNIVLDLLFVIGLNWGVAGVAVATAIAQYVSAFMIYRHIIKTYEIKLIVKGERIVDPDSIRIIVQLGIPIALSSLITNAGTLIIQRYGNTFGSDFVAANTVITRVDTFALMPLGAISQAITTFVGQNIGAGNTDRVKEGVRKGTIIVVAFSVIAGLIMIFFGKFFVILFNREEAIIALGSAGLAIMAFSYWSTGIQQSYSSMLRGAGDVNIPTIVTIIGMAIRIPLTYLLAIRPNDFKGMFYAVVIANIISAIFILIYYKFGNWQEKGIAKRKATAEKRRRVIEGKN